ncbi:hypothetical protein [Sorangium sp. So ce693]|uniref:hypothetical protein n=1 Tax=Sorangium sp. So ce693 TaxID=3133318 RepID=UPI003F5D652D
MTVPAGGASVPASTGAREDSAAQAITKSSGVQHNNPIPEAISERLARRGLLENVLAARNLGDEARAAHAVLLEKDREKLKEMSDDLSLAMDDLDDPL